MKKIILIALISLLGISLFNKSHTQQTSVTKSTDTPLPTRPREVYVGAWVGGSWDNKTRTFNKEVVNKFEQSIDKKLAIVNIYVDWTYLPNTELLKTLNEISLDGATPMISSNPLFFEGCPKKNKPLYRAVADGDCDEFLKKAAENLSHFKKPVMLRFAWEMNLPNMYWSVSKLESTSEDFVNAWRHFYLVTKPLASNVVWVLSFNTTNSNTIPYKDLFPGDQYIDWVAIDGYNWGNSHSWSGWASFDGTFKNSYKELTDLTSKPVMLSEVNSAPNGGDKTKWLDDMLNMQIPNRYSQVKSIIFFNENKEDGESVDWRLEKSAEYLSVVKKALKQNIYLSSFK